MNIAQVIECFQQLDFTLDYFLHMLMLTLCWLNVTNQAVCGNYKVFQWFVK